MKRLALAIAATALFLGNAPAANAQWWNPYNAYYSTNPYSSYYGSYYDYGVRPYNVNYVNPYSSNYGYYGYYDPYYSNYGYSSRSNGWQDLVRELIYNVVY